MADNFHIGEKQYSSPYLINHSDIGHQSNSSIMEKFILSLVYKYR